jgi:hypothetical protein
VAEVFEVAVSTAVKWLQRWRDSGSSAPNRAGGRVVDFAQTALQCPFRNFLNRLNQLDFKGGGLIRGGVADVDA